MNPLNLKNNALFLSCWYERSRPMQLICFGIMLLGILLLTFMSVSAHETKPEVIWESLFYVMVVLQAVVLLIQGTLFAGHLSAREKTSATLEFHRNSPEPVVAKIFGLVFGSTWFEWAVFLLLFVWELPFAFVLDIQMSQILLWNMSLILSGVFFHTTWATISLLSTKKKRGSSLGAILLLVFFGGPFFMYILSTASAPFFAHAFGITGFQYIFAEEAVQFGGTFYTLELPLIIIQAIAQIPLFFLIINGMRRTFRKPNSPAWSKADVLCFCGFLFFMVTGFFIADYMNIDDIIANKKTFRFYVDSFEGFFRQEASFYSVLYLGVGFLISFFCVPSYFKRSKYVVLSRQGLLKKRMMLLHDGATSLYTIIVYAFIGGIFLIPYIITAQCSVLKGLLSMTLLSSHILAFSGFLEFFRLSRFRKNKLFFITAMLIWWVFIPWMVFLTLDYNASVPIFSGSISPFYGLLHAQSLLIDQEPVNFIVLIVPFFIASLMWLLAKQEHEQVERQESGL